MQSINNHNTAKCTFDMKLMVLEREFCKLSIYAKQLILTSAQLPQLFEMIIY